MLAVAVATIVASEPWLERYTIYFAHGDTVAASQKVRQGKSVAAPSIQLSKVGYSFEGWRTEDLTVWDFSRDKVTKDTTLYSTWSANSNSIVFNKNAEDATGTMLSQAVATDDSVYLSLNAFDRDGYTFAGWAETPGGEAVYADGGGYTMGAEPRYTLYAVWSINDNTLAFNSNGGSRAMAPQNIADGATIILPANEFIKAGYTFVGWSTTPGGTAEYNDKSHYMFSSNAGCVLYAVWEANINTVIFNANGGKGSMNPQEISTDASAKLSKAAFTKEGFIFAGWANSAIGGVAYADEAVYKMGEQSSYTLYAVWTASESWVVTFDTQGGSEVAGQTVAKNTKATLPKAPSLAGYTFAGWFTEPECKTRWDFSGKIRKDMVLYAGWKANSNTLSFNANGGSGTMESVKMDTDSGVYLPLNAFTKGENWAFADGQSRRGEKRFILTGIITSWAPIQNTPYTQYGKAIPHGT